MHARCQDQVALSALLMSLFRREIVLLAIFRLEPLRLVRHSSPLVYIVNVSGLPQSWTDQEKVCLHSFPLCGCTFSVVRCRTVVTSSVVKRSIISRSFVSHLAGWALEVEDGTVAGGRGEGKCLIVDTLLSPHCSGVVWFAIVAL